MKKKIIGSILALASMGAGFLVALPSASATDGVVTVRIYDASNNTEYNQQVSVTTQQELDLSAGVDCHQLLSKEDCVGFANNCICSSTTISRHTFLPANTILVMDVDP